MLWLATNTLSCTRVPPRPLLWAPLSEMYGRRLVFIITYLPFIVWLAACIGSPDITSLLVFRFLAGTFSSSMLTNSGAVIGDMFNGPERGKPIALFAAAVFCGPVLGVSYHEHTALSSATRQLHCRH